MQIRSWPRWLRIVSTRIAVLPVVRSPMISSRWPRPIGIIESIDFRPGRAGAGGGVAERVDNPADQLRADGHARDGARPLDRLALLDVLPLAEERGADVVLLEVEREAGDAVLELEHLGRERVLEAVDARDPVADLQHGADLGEVALDVVLLDPLLEDRSDLFGAKLHESPL